MAKIPNRFKGLGYVNVHALRLSFMAGCLFNLFLFFIFLVVGGVFFLFTSPGVAGPEEVVISTVPPLPAIVVTVPALAAIPAPPTLPPAPTFTPWPTFTPAPTITPFPTLAPLPTSTPFTLTVVLAVPSPTPTRLYNYGELLAGAPTPALVSEHKYAFYRAVCVDGLSRISPKVFGLPQVVQGLHWRLWNDYGWASDTANEKDFEESYADDVSFFLSPDPSIFHIALFYYDQQISDIVMLDYPGRCPAIEVVYLRAARSSGYDAQVWLPAPGGGVVLTDSQVISVSVSQ